MFRFLKRRTKSALPPLWSDNHTLGKYGEDEVAKHLQKGGYKILQRNKKYAAHEVDIIAKDGNTVVFCEVKTRTASAEMQKKYGSPADFITAEQKRNLFAAANAYLRLTGEGKWRFDAAEVILCRTESGFSIESLHYIKDAFRP